MLSSLQIRLQMLCRLYPMPWRSGRASLGKGLGLVHALALVVELVFLLMVLLVLGVLGKLVVLVWLLLELLDLQSPQVDEEEKTGPHRHEQVPLLGLHVCYGGEEEEDVVGRTRGKGQDGGRTTRREGGKRRERLRVKQVRERKWGRKNNREVKERGWELERVRRGNTRKLREEEPGSTRD